MQMCINDKMVCIILHSVTTLNTSNKDINYIVPVSKGKQVRNCSVTHITNYTDILCPYKSVGARSSEHHVQQAKQCTFIFIPFCISHAPIYAFKIESLSCLAGSFSSYRTDKLQCNVHKTMCWQQVCQLSVLLIFFFLKFNTFHKWLEKKCTFRIQNSNRYGVHSIKRFQFSFFSFGFLCAMYIQHNWINWENVRVYAV